MRQVSNSAGSSRAINCDPLSEWIVSWSPNILFEIRNDIFRGFSTERFYANNFSEVILLNQDIREATLKTRILIDKIDN